MSQEMCRICLTNVNLKLLFSNIEESEKLSTIFTVTTGLQIEPNDGLPQKICEECSELVSASIKLRNLAQNSENKLLNLGFRRNLENQPAKISENIMNDEKSETFDNLSTDCYDFDGFKIEIELDRISENGGDEKEVKEAEDATEQPVKKNSRKEKTDLYLSMVEGEFNSKGPVKCKICKKSVSKWACFINHAKKHLGFQFVCEFCGKSFISSNQLKRHCRSYHGMERELKCKNCSYLALDNAQLKVHERRMHTGDRPYVCDVCAASYFSRKCLVQHIESHRTTASIQCDKCPALFKSRRHLAKHRYGAHTDKRRQRRREKRLYQKTDTQADSSATR